MEHYWLSKNHISGTLSTAVAKSIAAAKSQNLCWFYRSTKMHKGKFWHWVHYHKYETDYILEIWEKDSFKKRYNICVTIWKIWSLSIFNILSSFSFCCITYFSHISFPIVNFVSATYRFNWKEPELLVKILHLLFLEKKLLHLPENCFEHWYTKHYKISTKNYSTYFL